MGKKRRRGPEVPTGILLVRKPLGPTSRELVEAVEKRLGFRGLGHCGTLDPLASGLLVLVAGQAGRLQDRLTGHDKVYRGEVTLGARSATDDAEGPLEPLGLEVFPERAEIEIALRAFLGEIEQRPPRHSAIRIDGERSWQKARRGDEVEIPKRRVRIDRIDVLSYEAPILAIEVHCGAGTYIRSLARDLGESLGIGAYLSALERRSSGPFSIDRAVDLNDLGPDSILSLEEALEAFPRVEIGAEELPTLLNGRVLEARGEVELEDDALIWCEGRIIGRAHRLGPMAFRLRRIVVHPGEDRSGSTVDSDRMSGPYQGDSN